MAHEQAVSGTGSEGTSSGASTPPSSADDASTPPSAAAAAVSSVLPGTESRGERVTSRSATVAHA
jgi:hypothetical protein